MVDWFLRRMWYICLGTVLAGCRKLGEDAPSPQMGRHHGRVLIQHGVQPTWSLHVSVQDHYGAWLMWDQEVVLGSLATSKSSECFTKSHWSYCQGFVKQCQDNLWCGAAAVVLLQGAGDRSSVLCGACWWKNLHAELQNQCAHGCNGQMPSFRRALATIGPAAWGTSSRETPPVWQALALSSLARPPDWDKEFLSPQILTLKACVLTQPAGIQKDMAVLACHWLQDGCLLKQLSLIAQEMPLWSAWAVICG